MDLLILKILALEPMHGWAIAQRIEQMSNDVLQVGQSALYPALHKLEHNGWIEAEWAGKKALAQEAAQWQRLAGAITAIVRTVQCGG